MDGHIPTDTPHASSFRPLGDQAVRVAFGADIDPEINAQVRQFCGTLAADPIPGVVEWVPAYATVAVYYQPWRVRYDELCARLAERLQWSSAEPLPDGRLVRIPVRYNGAAGPDLEEVAARRGLTAEEVIARHTAPTYLVYMVGFMPGFAYLGGLDSSLATPRRDTPRARVPAGSVGIGGAQTGVYPLATPGGWQIIGRTPLTLYDTERDPPALLQAGDRVQFVAEGSDADD